MSALNGKRQLTLVGEGRIGGALKKRLLGKGWRVKNCRIDRQFGLLAEPGQHDNLLICIAPGRRQNGQPRWRWSQLLKRFAEQVRLGEQQIGRLIFVSSTRVYEGYKSGLIEARLMPRVYSERGVELLKAERLLQGLAGELHLVRCSGLYGPGYRHYEPIMRAATDRPRFGVSQEGVVDKLESLLEPPLKMQQRAHLLTDGYCYYQGRRWFFDSALAMNPRWPQYYALLRSSSDEIKNAF